MQLGGQFHVFQELFFHPVGHSADWCRPETHRSFSAVHLDTGGKASLPAVIRAQCWTPGNAEAYWPSQSLTSKNHRLALCCSSQKAAAHRYLHLQTQYPTDHCSPTFLRPQYSLLTQDFLLDLVLKGEDLGPGIGVHAFNLSREMDLWV